MTSAADSCRQLTRVVAWAHDLLAAALRPGDLAVDLTAGSGRDTLFLFHCVGLLGRVLAFDVQAAALQQTAALAASAGATLHLHGAALEFDTTLPGIHLLHQSHQQLLACLPTAPQAIIANLGFLPGGDPAVTTRRDSTLAALEQALTALAPGGRLAVVAYPGHPAGREEAQAVDELFAALAPPDWKVLRLSVPNRRQVPFLLVAEKLL